MSPVTSPFRAGRVARRAVPALVVASLLGWGGIALAGADGWPEVRNPVGVLNVQPDRVVDEQRWSLAEVSGGVDAENKAVAVSSCERCRTAAAAIEVVLVSDLAGPLDAENHAEAVNLDCSTCATAATAHQFVVASSRRVWLTAAGREQLDALRLRFERLELTSTPDALAAEVATIAAAVGDVLDHELRAELPSTPADPPAQGDPGGDPLSMSMAVAPYEIHHAEETSTAPATG